MNVDQYLFVSQYALSGALSLIVSAYVLIKKPRTIVSKFLFFFGIVVSVWEFSSFLSKTAPDVTTAANLYKIALSTSHICFPIYLLTVLNIKGKIGAKVTLATLVPVIAQIALMFQNGYFGNYEFSQSEFGWIYRVVSYRLPLILTSIIFLGYLLTIPILLFKLARGTTLPLLKRKYAILLFSFLFFQVVGTTLTNALIALNFFSDFFRIGGVLQFLTFLSIWYALSLKEEKVLTNGELKDFSRIYSSFLTVLYNNATTGQLGEESFIFSNFLKRSRIENNVFLSKGKISFEESKLNVINLVNSNLKIFEENPRYDKVNDFYLRVLNAAERESGTRFEAVVKENEDFLKKSDLIYGISGGRFLDEIYEDKSLGELDGIDACLRIYKRILLSLCSEISKTDLDRILSKTIITRNIAVTSYGEISFKGIKDRLPRISTDERLSLIIETFNSVLGQTCQRILSDADADSENVMKYFRRVLVLNKDRAVELGVYPTLLGMLATKIPQTKVHQLYSDYLEELVEERTRELNAAHENLVKSQRLATIGEAAAMVGHDLRNPLQAIVNTLYLTKKELESSTKENLEMRLDRIDDQVQYMNKIVSDLQDFARPLSPKRVRTNMSQLVNDTLSMVKIPENVKICVADAENFSVDADPLLLRRVFTNLITNAFQAMPNGGQLTVRISRNGDSVFIDFQDTGIGIPEKDLSKLFSPFFTTKSKGQGLGLAVCKRIIEALGGSISVESEEGRGTLFRLEIPFIYAESLTPSGNLVSPTG